MSLPPGVGRRLPPPDTGPLPAAHSDVASVHLSDVSGPPAPPNRAPGAPMAGPTTVGGANPPQSGGRRPAPAPLGSPGNYGPANRGGRRPPPGGMK